MAAPCGFSIWTEKLYDSQGMNRRALPFIAFEGSWCGLGVFLRRLDMNGRLG
jgi:hypothetical protein